MASETDGEPVFAGSATGSLVLAQFWLGACNLALIPGLLSPPGGPASQSTELMASSEMQGAHGARARCGNGRTRTTRGNGWLGGIRCTLKTIPTNGADEQRDPPKACAREPLHLSRVFACNDA